MFSGKQIFKVMLSFLVLTFNNEVMMPMLFLGIWLHIDYKTCKMNVFWVIYERLIMMHIRYKEIFFPQFFPQPETLGKYQNK